MQFTDEKVSDFNENKGVSVFEALSYEFLWIIHLFINTCSQFSEFTSPGPDVMVQNVRK